MADALPVSNDEILAAYEDAPDKVWSLQQLAERIWRKRGGEGAFVGAARLRSPDVPLVGPHAIRGPLTELCQADILTSAVGEEASKLGDVSEGPRDGIRYYGLTSTAARFSAREAEAEQALDIEPQLDQAPPPPAPQESTPARPVPQRANDLHFSHGNSDSQR